MRRLLPVAAAVLVAAAIAGSATAAPLRTLTISTSGPGKVTGPGINCGSDCTQAYADGTTVVLQANPATNSSFAGWGGACSGTGTCTVKMSSDQVVTASFTPQRTLTVSTSGSGSGHVNGPGINCPGDCSQVFDKGTHFVLTATADSDSAFAGWSGACSGTGPCKLTMAGNRSVDATFNAQRTLTVSKAGSGGGRVTSSPAGIKCGASCSFAYDFGTTVILTAAPKSGARFEGWSGACSGTATCSVTMDAAKGVVANFTARRTLSVSIRGRGHGHVTGPGIDCPGDCTQSYDKGKAVTLRTPHGASSRFDGWSGACSLRGICSLRMHGDHSVAAKFSLKPPRTTITEAKVSRGRHRAQFEFQAKGRSNGFQCKLTRKRGKAKRFRGCHPPKLYRHLSRGQYTFKVRAKGPGGTEPTASKKTFRI
jgi:hypothetical protein